MNALPMTGVAWRTGGVWMLLSLRIWFYLTNGRLSSFPPRGFVGVASTSFRATGPRHSKLLSIRMRREVSTRSAHLWRLTCVWRTGPPRSLKLKSGSG